MSEAPKPAATAPAPAVKKNDNKFIKSFLAGGISAAISKTCVAPIERIKLLLQTQDVNKKMESGAVKKYTGIIDCAIRVPREEGIGAFWRGNFANVLRYFPTQALNFAFKGFFVTTFNPYNPKTDPFKFAFGNLMSGGMAGAVSLTFVYALDFARTRLGGDVGKGKDREFTGLVDVLKKTYQQGGIRAIYNGYLISVIGIFAYRAIYFGMFDSYNGIFAYGRRQGKLEKYIVAQTVTALAGVASYPLDTIRRRLMMQSGKEVKNYSGTLDCARKIFATEGGFKPFFKGAFANVFRGFGAALVLVFYEDFEKQLNKLF